MISKDALICELKGYPDAKLSFADLRRIWKKLKD